jgi:hypothetical protein
LRFLTLEVPSLEVPSLRRMPRTPPRKGGVIAFGCSPHLFRLERASSLSPGCGREKPHRRQAKPRGSHANRLSPFRSFHRVAQTRPSPLPIVGAVPSWSRLPGWAPRRRIGPHEFCSFFTPCRIFGLSTSTVETTAPRWMSQVRRGTPTTVGKGRFGEDGKT